MAWWADYEARFYIGGNHHLGWMKLENWYFSKMLSKYHPLSYTSTPSLSVSCPEKFRMFPYQSASHLCHPHPKHAAFSLSIYLFVLLLLLPFWLIGNEPLRTSAAEKLPPFPFPAKKDPHRYAQAVSSDVLLHLLAAHTISSNFPAFPLSSALLTISHFALYTRDAVAEFPNRFACGVSRGVSHDHAASGFRRTRRRVFLCVSPPSMHIFFSFSVFVQHSAAATATARVCERLRHFSDHRDIFLPNCSPFFPISSPLFNLRSTISW